MSRYHRHLRIRSKISGTAVRPRLCVFRSLKANYAQLIDDEHRKVLVTVSDLGMKEKAKKVERAMKVGEVLAEKALTMGITTCVFDRAGYQYHGRVKALAEGARKGGLKF